MRWDQLQDSELRGKMGARNQSLTLVSPNEGREAEGQVAPRATPAGLVATKLIRNN